MRYMLQMNTGAFNRCAATPFEAEQKLRKCARLLPIDAVIFGWSVEADVNRAIARAAAELGLETYLWLPVFSELARMDGADRFVYGGGGAHEIRLCRDESFAFVCPSSEGNIAGVKESFALLRGDIPVTGVFLDRIRYPSAANAPRALWGCRCERCRELYARRGVSAADLESLVPEDFLPEGMRCGRYRFANRTADALMAVRRDIITGAVEALCDFFHRMRLRVGIDVFAPVVADYVGQDVCALGALADFIKPMQYRRTYAPAGIPFEMQALDRLFGKAFEERLRGVWNGDALSDAANVAQMRLLARGGARVCPGIETNCVADICDADANYAVQSIQCADSAGCEHVVLSWDALRMDETTLREISERIGQTYFTGGSL